MVPLHSNIDFFLNINYLYQCSIGKMTSNFHFYLLVANTVWLLHFELYIWFSNFALNKLSKLTFRNLGFFILFRSWSHLYFFDTCFSILINFILKFRLISCCFWSMTNPLDENSQLHSSGKIYRLPGSKITKFWKI